MTKDSIIECADRLRPNIVKAEDKNHWVDVVENLILCHMTQHGEFVPEISEAELLLGDEYRDMYAYYVVAMIDLANGDIAMYNNSCSFFNDMFMDWKKKWRRENVPPKDTKVVS